MSMNIHKYIQSIFDTYPRGKNFRFRFVVCDIAVGDWLFACAGFIKRFARTVNNEHWKKVTTYSILMSSVIRNLQNPPPKIDDWTIFFLLLSAACMDLHIVYMYTESIRPTSLIFTIDQCTNCFCSPSLNRINPQWRRIFVMLADTFMIIIFNENASKSS